MTTRLDPLGRPVCDYCSEPSVYTQVVGVEQTPLCDACSDALQAGTHRPYMRLDPTGTVLREQCSLCLLWLPTSLTCRPV